jgi:hypothetical protein
LQNPLFRAKIVKAAFPQNGKVLGTLRSTKLANGILRIYVGKKPADESLKEGMLGIR